MSNKKNETVVTKNDVGEIKASDIKAGEIKAEGIVKIKPKRKMNSMEEFLDAHEESNSYEELAEKLGITKGSAYQRARQYRAKKVDLKIFPRQKSVGRQKRNLEQDANDYLAKKRNQQQEATT